MCEQCVTDCLHYGQVLPGWYLIRAQKDGNLMKIHQWGLLRCNDPDFVWTVDPIVDITYGMSDDQVDALPDDQWNLYRKFSNSAEKFEQSLKGDIRSGYSLYKACLEAGYDPEVDGYNLSHWLLHSLAVRVSENVTVKED